MKKFILSLVIGLILVYLGDYFIGETLKFFYFKTTSGGPFRTTYSIDKSEADIFIFGSSRANHHYDVKLIEEKTRLSAYNAGRDGSSIFYQTAILRSILNRQTPKTIILDFHGTFEFNQEDYDGLSSLLPYYNSHRELRDMIELKSPFETYKLVSKIYPYNSLLTSIVVGNLEINKDRDEIRYEYKGFVPLKRQWKGKIDSLETPVEYEIDNNKMIVLEEFIELTKKRKIPLVVVYSPVYYLFKSNYSIDLCKDICEKNDIVFVDYSKDFQFLTRRDLFADKNHLNTYGASLLTENVLKLMPNDK